MSNEIDRWGEALDFEPFLPTARRREFPLVGYVLIAVTTLLVISVVRGIV